MPSEFRAALRTRWLTLVQLLCTLAIVAGCDAHYQVNAPEKKADIREGYRLERVKADPDNPGDVLVILTLSGGGTRAASLAYGTMEALRDVTLKIGGRSRTLLDEVDIINAVSGGSIVAAYYAVHRDGLFRDFERKFLKRDIESELRTALLANLPRLAHARFSRGDLLAEYFDRELFDGATYADLARGSMRPFVVINAAALATGARFPFTQGQFDLLCSDLGSVPIGRAVAASAALPPYFSAITLQSYAGTCGPAPLPGLSKHSDVVGNLSKSVRLEETRTYLDRARRPYVHLVDGGLIDNLGLRVAADFAVEQGGFFELVEALGYGELTHVVFISVNAETDPNFAIDQVPDSPNFWQTLNALKLPGRAHSQDLANQLRSSFDAWRDELKSRRANPSGAPDSTPRFYFIDVSISAIQDENERNSFNNVPTALTLDPVVVDRLRAIARRLLLESPALKQLIADLGN
jgi:NTE family protein